MENSKIQWTDHTANFWGGCTKVSPGCVNCYAETATPCRTFGIEWGPGKPRHLFANAGPNVATWNKRAHREREQWREKCLKDGKPLDEITAPPRAPRVFWNSLSDWLDPEVSPEWRADLLECIFRSPYLEHVLLTKRPENFQTLMRAAYGAIALEKTDFAKWLKNWFCGIEAPRQIILMATAENQETANARIPVLIDTPAARRGISVEPMLSPVDLRAATLVFPVLDWCIAGGESGPKARPCQLEWLKSLGEQCTAFNVPFFLKQIGSNAFVSGAQYETKHPKGGEIAEWPADMVIRQQPAKLSTI